MSNKFQSKLLMSAVLVGLLLSVQASAATVFTLADAEQLSSLNNKLVTAADDINDAWRNDPAASCLDGITNNVNSVGVYLTSALNLLTLAALMRDKRDELYVLDSLSRRLDAVAKKLSGSRQSINKWMGICSRSATVNIKGQAVINIFSEIEQALAPVSDKVHKALR